MEYSIAENYINRALALEPNRCDIVFLKAITLYLQNKDEEALETLNSLVSSGYIHPRVIELMEILNNRKI